LVCTTKRPTSRLSSACMRARSRAASSCAFAKILVAPVVAFSISTVAARAPPPRRRAASPTDELRRLETRLRQHLVARSPRPPQFFLDLFRMGDAPRDLL